jgi:hypothetical protein
LAVWSDRKATREENTNQSLREKAAAFDWLSKAIKARRNAGNDIPDRKDVDGNILGDNGSAADRVSNQRYRRD